MLKGHNLPGLKESSEGNKSLRSFSPVTKNTLPEQFAIATGEKIDIAVGKATSAFLIYKNISASEKALFFEMIADEIIALGDKLMYSKQKLLLALKSLHGQLTATVYATPDELNGFSDSIEILENKIGRILYNGVPTGVEVSHAMVYGGPYPSTTNANSTSVGADAIKRFVRPLCFQDCPVQLLPKALQNSNPLNIMRKVNAFFTREGL